MRKLATLDVARCGMIVSGKLASRVINVGAWRPGEALLDSVWKEAF